jgi:cytosine/adenosine deaminase-related metal-dependent hydrolase
MAAFSHAPFAGLTQNGPMNQAIDMQWTAHGWHAGKGEGRWRVPGIANLHSHAFQRAMAGLAERQTNPEDSFWTWRETMYRFAARFDPDTLRAVASQLYVEMLQAGYTTVCEFHYLHHAPDGTARRELTEHHPQRAAHVMAQIRAMRGGRDNDPGFGSRMRGTGPVAELLRDRFRIAVRRLGLGHSRECAQNVALFAPPAVKDSSGQLSLGW